LRPEPANGAVNPRPAGWMGRAFRILRQFRADLREPLPGTSGLGRGARLRARFEHLLRRYGWKILIAIFFYYLIRDTILYLIIPFLVAKQLLR
jgi:hypothetical protein